jgi:hypothetical protein
VADDDLPITEGSLQLVVAWASGARSIGRSIKTADAVNAALRDHAQVAVESLTDPAPYAPDADMEDNSHLEADPEELLDTSLVEELQKGASLPLATEAELSSKPLLCHALLIGEGENQTIFVRKRSPLQFAKKSLVAQLIHDTLDRLESPVFAFDNRYDVIITRDKVYILNKNAFEGLFKDSGAVLAQTDEWVKEVAKTIPMAEGSTEVLEAVLKKNQFLRRKFLAVKERPHIKTMTPDTLRAEIERHGYPTTELMDGDNLKVTSDNAKLVLQLLNEDLFSGGFSHERYAASSKRPVS